MRAMIFAAGLGTRLRPLTDTLPKALVPVGGEPLLHRLLVKLRAAGCTHAVVNVHHHAAQVIEFLAGHDYNMRMDISDESNMLLDTGGGLRHAAPFFHGDEPILVHNVDILSNLPLDSFYASFNPNNMAQVVVSKRTTSRYLLFDNNGRLAGWHNIKTGETRPAGIDTSALHPYAFSGIHIVSPRIFTLMADYPDKFSIIDFYLNTIHAEQIAAYIPKEFAMLDVGKTDTLAAADNFVAKYGL